MAALAVALAAASRCGVRAQRGRRSLRGRGCSLVLEVAARRAGAPQGVLRATFLDVGQGDSAIVDLPDGEAMVIDGGGLVGSPIDVGVARPRARAAGAPARRRSRAVVLTHPHPDHFGGLATGLERRARRRALGHG